MPIEHDNTGITIQNLTEILDEREAYLQTDDGFGSDFVIKGDSPTGNLQYADASREQELQELVQYLANQMNVETAEGVFLDYIAFRNFVTRQSATYTVIPITVTGTANLTVEAFKLTILDQNTDRLYVNRESFTIGTGGTIDVNFSCTDFGPVSASSTSTYVISTPVLGVTAIEYKSGGVTTVGSNTETDAEFRARRDLLLDLLATSTTSSIRSAVLEVSGVTHCSVTENDTMSTVDTIPAKAFEAVVLGGDDTEVAQAILSKKPAGIQAYGTTVESVTDADEDTFDIGFTRPSEVPIEMRITVKVTSSQPTEWEDAVKSAIVTQFESLYGPSNDIFAFNFYSILDSYSEIENVTQLEIQKVIDSALWNNTVAIGKREYGSLSVDDITITQTT